MMNRNLFIVGILAMLQACTTLSPETKSDYSNAMKLDSTQFNALHEHYRENALLHRRFKHDEVDSLVKKHRGNALFSIKEIGKSFENRSIYKLQYGKGGTKVMLWSQMHGDEPTATMALFDLFNFFEGKDDGFDSVRQLLNDKLDIHFIPMLNPDGAERYTRRNAQHIDLNRDARVGQTVEGALLRRIAKEVKPSYGFNLHDQSIYYNVPGTKNPVAISMLAPAYNEAREVNEVRRGAMQLIVGMHALLQQYVPDAVAKYDDTYSPRGFGDNFQSWGASTVLIESGGKKGDPEKQELRRLNFAIILNALMEIAQGSYRQYDPNDYDKIPFNASQMHDVVLRGIDLGTDSVSLKTDIALRRTEMTMGRDYFVRGHVEDIGDLDIAYGYDELAAQDLKFVQGKTYPQTFETVDEITMDCAWNLLKEGFVAVKVNSKGTDHLHDLPLVVFTQSSFTPTAQISLLGTSNFLLASGGMLKYAVINGYLIDLSQRPKAKFFKNRVI
ncbi:M14 family zinc carboxypeptidase [Sphingobacterium griseoflavum]|uniref:Peptidase M14 domain-containing protein n=1 Tax=Sphingobacterium griseoflavum TaxID=1474952 RepID=A0ABQ3HSV4_9SPHI|nr:M14 family zinc carboxypeptidase [Sphingobacterium griseoflavum]GHE31031.1 hypothetical protein GCM10017764_12590 [Sphingobacterium griseoflavum]